MTATSATLAGRAAAEFLMTDACTVERQTGESLDEATGKVTPTYASVYSGKCRVQTRDVQPSTVQVGEAESSLLSFTVSLPVSAGDVQVSDRVTVTASALDPALVGRVFTVTGVGTKSFLTARRLECEAVQ